MGFVPGKRSTPLQSLAHGDPPISILEWWEIEPGRHLVKKKNFDAGEPGGQK